MVSLLNPDVGICKCLFNTVGCVIQCEHVGVCSTMRIAWMISHKVHMNMVSLLCEYAYVYSRDEESKNDFPHCSHEYGFSPVWVRIWIFKAEDCVNDFPQCSQEYGFSPVWICMWLVKFEGTANDSHNNHMNMVSLLYEYAYGSSKQKSVWMISHIVHMNMVSLLYEYACVCSKLKIVWMISHNVHMKMLSLLYEYACVCSKLRRLYEWFPTMFTWKCFLSCMKTHVVSSKLKIVWMISHNVHMKMLSLLYEYACVSSKLKIVWMISHNVHMNMVSLLCEYACVSSKLKIVWMISHNVHMNMVSLLCEYACVSSKLKIVWIISHNVHMNMVSLLCEYACVSSKLKIVWTIFHIVYMNMVSLLYEYAYGSSKQKSVWMISHIVHMNMVSLLYENACVCPRQSIQRMILYNIHMKRGHQCEHAYVSSMLRIVWMISHIVHKNVVFLLYEHSCAWSDENDSGKISHIVHMNMVSLLYEYAYGSSKQKSVWIIFHKVHMNMVSLLYEYIIWFFKFEDCVNDFPHCSQEYGFSPVWIWHVASQIWRYSKRFPTIITWIWFLSCMSTHMDLQIWRLYEWFPTLFTWIWSLSCMSTHVCIQGWGIQEWFTTIFTWKEVTSVKTHMSVQRWRLREWFLTKFTWIWFLSLCEYACGSSKQSVWMISHIVHMNMVSLLCEYAYVCSRMRNPRMIFHILHINRVSLLYEYACVCPRLRIQRMIFYNIHMKRGHQCEHAYVCSTLRIVWMISHIVHMNMVSSPVWVRICPFTAEDCVNDFPQSSHEYWFLSCVSTHMFVQAWRLCEWLPTMLTWMRMCFLSCMLEACHVIVPSPQCSTITTRKLFSCVDFSHSKLYSSWVLMNLDSQISIWPRFLSGVHVRT